MVLIIHILVLECHSRYIIWFIIQLNVQYIYIYGTFSFPLDEQLLDSLWDLFTGTTLPFDRALCLLS